MVLTTPFGCMPDPDHICAPFGGDQVRWLLGAGLQVKEVRVADKHVLPVAVHEGGAQPDLQTLLHQAEKATEAAQRFWIGERDGNYVRGETLLTDTVSYAPVV